MANLIKTYEHLKIFLVNSPCTIGTLREIDICLYSLTI